MVDKKLLTRLVDKYLHQSCADFCHSNDGNEVEDDDEGGEEDGDDVDDGDDGDDGDWDDEKKKDDDKRMQLVSAPLQSNG